MLKSLHVPSSVKEEKIGPSPAVINAILNYSKSLEIKTVKQKKTLIHLN